MLGLRIFLVATLFMLLFGCAEDENDHFQDQPFARERSIDNLIEDNSLRPDDIVITPVLVGADYSGCFDHKNLSKEIDERYSSVWFSDTIINDTLNMEIVLFHNCCASLTDSLTIDGNVVNIYVADNGTICDCMCTYTMNYFFTDYGYIHFIVYLKDFDVDFYEFLGEYEYSGEQKE